MKLPCSKCSFSYTYPVGKKIKHSPNTNKDECRSCYKYKQYENYKSGKRKTKGYGCEGSCEALQKARDYASKLYKENCQLKQQIAELQKNNQNKRGDSK